MGTESGKWGLFKIKFLQDPDDTLLCFQQLWLPGKARKGESSGWTAVVGNGPGIR